MELIEKYSNLLSFFDPKKYDQIELAKIIDKLITNVNEKGGEHQAGCAWVIMTLYRRNKCNVNQFNTIIDEFNEYCKGYEEYIDSLSLGNNADAPMTYYNGFLDKKTKGN